MDYRIQPMSDYEMLKVLTMMENGATYEGACKSRVALRRKRHVEQVNIILSAEDQKGLTRLQKA